jgi:hypothetical protein
VSVMPAPRVRHSCMFPSKHPVATSPASPGKNRTHLTQLECLRLCLHSPVRRSQIRHV